MRCLPLIFLGIFSVLPAFADEPALRQATIKGLLVVELGDGSHAGKASQMNGTVVKGRKGSFEVKFNQPVGAMMDSATKEVEKFMSVRYGDKLPSDTRIELAFADKYSPKDGPSAAVVSALLCDSILSGDVIDEGFAATGDMTATGEVRPIGGLAGKIRGAIKKKCTLLGAPKANEISVNDLSLIEGLEPLYQIQIFTIATFDEARAVAMKERSATMQKAIDEFAMVQVALNKDEKYLKNVKVREKLRTIVKLAPNHVSARLLYLHSVRKGPKTLSLPGSLMAIEKAATEFSSMLTDGTFMATGGNDNVLFGLVNEIARMRPTLDKRTLEYCDSFGDMAQYMKTIRSRTTLQNSHIREINEHVATIQTERTQLMNNKEVREELMLD